MKIFDKIVALLAGLLYLLLLIGAFITMVQNEEVSNNTLLSGIILTYILLSYKIDNIKIKHKK